MNLRELIYRRYNISFSKSGDDIQLMKLINNRTPGTFVDIGCWHPVKASNSYYFSLREWKGICIDPNPELHSLYKKIRPKDQFINCAIGQGKAMNYYALSEANSSMNSLDYDFIKSHGLEHDIQSCTEVPLRPLEEILNERLSDACRLDFFDVDVEGFDLEVLKTNNWNRFRPKVILIESAVSIKDDLDSEISLYLASVNYRLIGKSIINNDLGNLFFIDNTSKPQ